VRAVLAGETIARQVEERIVYPSDIGRIRSEQPGRAREIQKINGEKFQRAFERGLAVTGFERSGTEGTYLLEPGA
jgi:predicted GNAT superfamily acetyltransferase